jgi:transglutaminase-like putative cysteine protease
MPTIQTDPALSATEFIDFEHPLVQEFVAKEVGDATDPTKVALLLYYAIRDQIRYNPYSIGLDAASFRASTTLQRGYGWCVPKAILLAACCRAKGIPARLGYADVKNHLTSKKLRESMQTDIFAWHGYTSIFLNNKWVKATPAFNKELCEKANIFPLEFNGKDDSIYHEFDKAGQKHMEYLRERGEFDDLPLAAMLKDFALIYGLQEGQEQDKELAASDFEEDVAKEN